MKKPRIYSYGFILVMALSLGSLMYLQSLTGDSTDGQNALTFMQHSTAAFDQTVNVIQQAVAHLQRLIAH